MSSMKCDVISVSVNRQNKKNKKKQTSTHRHTQKGDTASLKSPEPHCVLAQQKQPIGNMQPETRRLPQRASHRPQSRDTPRVLLIQAGTEPQPVIQPFSANTHTTENDKRGHPRCFVQLTSRPPLKMGVVNQVCLELCNRLMIYYIELILPAVLPNSTQFGHRRPCVARISVTCSENAQLRGVNP